MIQREPLGRKKEIMREMLKTDGISTRQLARITGVSANLVWRASREGFNNHERSGMGFQGNDFASQRTFDFQFQVRDFYATVRWSD